MADCMEGALNYFNWNLGHGKGHGNLKYSKEYEKNPDLVNVPKEYFWNRFRYIGVRPLRTTVFDWLVIGWVNFVFYCYKNALFCRFEYWSTENRWKSVSYGNEVNLKRIPRTTFYTWTFILKKSTRNEPVYSYINLTIISNQFLPKSTSNDMK